MRTQVICIFFLVIAACSTASNGQAEPVTTNVNSPLEFTNNAYGQFARVNGPANPAEYFVRRSKAVQLSYEGEWEAARPILAELVSEYGDDGDTWYLLGLSYMKAEKWAEAIPALERTIELGTALKGVPSGSSPSNDIMVKIAEAYAALGDAQNVKIWMEKALTARYDDRPFLSGKPHFEKALSTDEYQKMIGAYVDSGLSRDELWGADLRALVSEIHRLHVNLHHLMPVRAFQDQVAVIEESIPSLSDQEIVFAFMELVGGLGSGHNIIIPTNGAKGSFSRLPVEFYWFSDGLFIVDSEEPYADMIGSEVTMIGGIPVADALAKTRALNARDNEMQHLWLAPYYVSLPEALKGLGIIESVDEVALTLADADGGKREITLSGIDWSFKGFPKLPKLKNVDQPQYLDRSDQLFWMESLPDHDAIFVQFNWVSERKENTLEAFSRELTAKIEKSHAKYLILDLRHNPGGNGSILPPLLRTLIHFNVANPDGKLFVIVGRGTYSAAHSLLTKLNGLTNAVIVGEPSGSRPNAISEAGWFKLPYSGLMGLASSQFHQTSSAEDHRIWIAPHIPVHLSSSDYFAGTDPALEAVFAVIDKSKNRNKNTQPQKPR